jgi:transcriptional regulator with XRE-family HTH domain
MKINEKIRQMRKSAGLTQEQLAGRLGISAQSISKWENGISMPDITLLPLIAETFGVSIDDLFDLTLEQKFNRIENRIEIKEELSTAEFDEYEIFLSDQLGTENKLRATALLAHLYHHRMEADSRKVSKYARDAIMSDPAKKECQWLLDKAEGHAMWDWNCSNHTKAIDFYKTVIDNDNISPRSSLPYYYLIDNLLADNRTAEAEKYLIELSRLPSATPVLVDLYPAYIALGKYDVEKADKIIEEYVDSHPDNGGYLFEAAQYYARKCDYEKAIELYERSWGAEEAEKPRFWDALQGIATIYSIMGRVDDAIKTHDRILECLKVEWGYSEDDKVCLDVIREKNEIITKLKGKSY